MTSHYESRPCSLAHLRELARTMRPEDRAEIEEAGCVVRHLLIELWRLSREPRAALIDGQVAAAWGDAGGLISTEGMMWAFTAPAIKRLPLAFFREARREIASYLQTRTLLRADVAASYARALRFWRLLGFTIGEPRPVGSCGELYREITIEKVG